jgi:hypothetical protein
MLPAGTSDEQRGDEHAEHGERDRYLHCGAEQQTDPSGKADLSSPLQVAQRHVFANGGADKRHEYEPPEPGKDSEQRAKHCSNHGLPACADAPGAQGCGDIVGDEAHYRQHRGDRDRPCGDAGKIVDPRTEQDAAEDQDRAGQYRQDDAGEAEHHEDGNRSPENDCDHKTVTLTGVQEPVIRVGLRLLRKRRQMWAQHRIVRR